MALATYTVVFTVPAGYQTTIDNAGSNDAVDSDGATVTGIYISNANDWTIDLGLVYTPTETPTNTVTLTPVAPTPTHTETPTNTETPTPVTPIATSVTPSVENAATATPVNAWSIGNFVWEDLNKNGIQDPAEPGIEGVTVILKDADGKEIARTQTDSNGHYEFNNLPNGEYTITFITPEGYDPTLSGVGGNAEVDSNGLETKLTLKDGNNFSIDLGLVSHPSSQKTPVPTQKATVPAAKIVAVPYTGDNTNALQYALMMLVSLLLGLGLLIVGRKRKTGN